MRLLLVFAVIIGVGSAASVKSDSDELKELLAQVRSYLDEPSHQRAARLTAYQDEQTVLANPNVAPDPSVGYWTKWLNVDNIWNYGTGEYEDCSRVKWQQNIERKCLLGCSSPLAAKYAVTGANTNATWADIEKCIGPIAGKVTGCGFKCSNLEVMNYPKTNCDLSKCEWYGLGKDCSRCPDIRVKFFCSGTKPPEDQCCPYSQGCTVEGKTGLRAALEDIEDMNERKDIIAGLLIDVRSALEVDED
jgi:hypothetical protein